MDRAKLVRRIFFCAVGGGLLLIACQTQAQEAPRARSVRSFSPGNSIRVSPTPVPSKPSSPPKSTSSKPPSKSSASSKPGASKPDDKSKKEGADGNSATVTRPNEPAAQPNNDAFDNIVEGEKVRINIKGHPWPDVLEWVAKISGLSFDWKELPGDYLNLVTRREYSVLEVRSMINRHLLRRGYTMLVNGEELTVANIKTINPAMVPRHKAEDLESLGPYDFVKVSFRLDWLLADKLVEELKPMVSTNGKLTKLSTTNRIEAMDSVINLREIHRLLEEEQSATGQENLVREFPLEFTQADEILDDLKILLGMPSGPAKPMTPQQMQQAQQRAMQLAQQNKGKAPPAPKVEIHLLANRRENSIIAQASPDKMAIIQAAIKRLDKPLHGGQTIPEIVDRMQVYRLTSIDPQAIVDALKNAGTLNPKTTVHVDSGNKAIIAYASLADHFTIRKMVERLDGSGRQFHVIPLRKLEAEYVAGTIQSMMGTDQKQNQSSSRSRVYYYGPIQPSRTSNNPVSKFSVEADTEYNRLLLRANELELKEVEDLLVQLGEIRVRGTNASTTRVLDAVSPTDVQEVLKRLKEAWPGIAPNQLEIDVPPPPKQEEPEKIDQPAPDRVAPADTRTEAKPVQKTPATAEILHHKAVEEQPIIAKANPNPVNDFIKVVQLKRELPGDATSEEKEASKTNGSDKTTDAEGNETSAPTKAPSFSPPVIRNPKYSKPEQAPPAATALPKVRITQGPDGRLIVSSKDPRVLDMLEEIMEQMAPKRRGYKIFKMKYQSTWAYSVALNLEDFFEDNEGKTPAYSYSPYYGFRPSGSSFTGTRKLGKKRPPRFIADSDTNTILVQGADEEQLKIIQELIDIYDVPLDSESKSIRITKAFYLKYGKASVIAQTIKDVYRDLLSSNDKALQNPNAKEKSRSAERSYTYIYGGGGDGDGDREPPIKFKGLLSVGIDDFSNTLIVSAAEGLMENISAMVEALDKAAQPASSVQVVPVTGRINPQLLERLQNIIGSGKKQPQNPQQQQRPQNGNIQPGQQKPNFNPNNR